MSFSAVLVVTMHAAFHLLTFASIRQHPFFVALMQQVGSASMQVVQDAMQLPLECIQLVYRSRETCARPTCTVTPGISLLPPVWAQTLDTCLGIGR